METSTNANMGNLFKIQTPDKMKTSEKPLPEKITIGERTFNLQMKQASENGSLYGLWSVYYEPEDKKSLFAYVHSKTFWYFLCTCRKSKEAAIADMKERIADMIIDNHTIEHNGANC